MSTSGRRKKKPAIVANDAEPAESAALGARLMTLSNLMRRVTAMRFQRTFDLSLVDGWIISRLGEGGAMSLDTLAYRSGLANSQMSRSVSNMVRRKLVDRRRNPDNQTELILTLTPEGVQTWRAIRRRWPTYGRLLLAGLDKSEMDALGEIVVKLIRNSRRNLLREQEGDRE